MGIFGSIIGVIAKVATTGYGLIKTALPILKALRPAIEEIDEGFTFIEGKIAQGGVAADDFLDKNIDVVIKIGQVAGRGVAAFHQMEVIAEKLRVFSQEQSPDTITEAEALELGREFMALRELFAQLGPEIDATVAAIEAVEE